VLDERRYQMIAPRHIVSLCTVVVIGLVSGPQARCDDLVPYQAMGWRSMQVPINDPLVDDFWRLDFDDSWWMLGQGAFGNAHPMCDISSTVHSPWDAETEMLLRRRFMADPLQPVTVHFAIDNDAVIYVNEVLIASVTHEFCPELDEFNVTVPDGVIVAGENTLAVRAIDRGGVSYVDVRLEGAPGAIPVAVDIKPATCPNPINVRVHARNAVITMAILGTADFDVTGIDPSTVTLEGVQTLGPVDIGISDTDHAAVTLEGVSPAYRWSIEDVSRPLPTHPDDCQCTTEGPDGFPDLVMHFNHLAVVNAVGLQHNGTLAPVTVNGQLTDGTYFTGRDCFFFRNGLTLVRRAHIGD
jgi:hypothetical protein